MGEIADAEEVLRVITGFLRSEELPPAERRRAAELLAKRYGLLKPDAAGAHAGRMAAAQAIEQALKAMRKEETDPSTTIPRS